MNKKVYFGTLFGILGFFAAIALIVVFLFQSTLGNICGTLELEGFDEPGKNVVNILAIGVDESETRSDTVILLSLNMKSKEVSMMSIPRDTRVKYNGMYDKLTHLFSYDSTGQLTLDTVKQVTGADINYMAIVNFDGFSKAIDELGGVYIDVPDLGRGGMYYEDPVQDLSIALKAGYQLLDGEQAEVFVRFRKGYANADLGRIEAQRYFLSELVNQKLKPKYIVKIPAVFDAIKEDVKTNYSCMDVFSQLIRMIGMDSKSINSYSLPGEAGMASTRYGTLSCYLYDEDETQELVKNYFSE